MTKIEEMRSTIETIHRMQMTALRVYEANEAYLEAAKVRDSYTYDWTCKDKENNDRYFAAIDEMNRKGGLVKKAVNAFFKAVGHPVKKYEFAFEAITDYNDYLRDTHSFYAKSPLPAFSLYECYARRD